MNLTKGTNHSKKLKKKNQIKMDSLSGPIPCDIINAIYYSLIG